MRLARRTTALTLTTFGVAPGTSLVDSALLIVSELVTNAVRHAAHCSRSIMVSLLVGAKDVVIDVSDQSPAVPALAPGALGEGLRTVVELGDVYGGTLSVEPVPLGEGKTMRVCLPFPEGR